MKDFIRKRIRFILTALFVALVMQGGCNFVSSHYRLAHSVKGHVCLPYKIWIIKLKEKKAVRNMYVAFKGENIPYLKNDNIIWVKILLGMPGDKIQYYPEKKKVFKTVTDSEGKKVKLKIKGYVLVDTRKGSYLLEVFETDTKGRPLPVIQETGTIPEGKYFVWTPHERSYDSRYWGLIDESQIVGTAYPVF